MAKLTRRQFIKGAVGSAAGASLFSSVGRPFVFAQTKEPIKVGYLEPMTGIFASLGIGMLKGAELAEKHINAAGGILGRPVKVLIEDEENKTEVATRKARRMILEEGAIAIHGSASTGVTIALCEAAKRNGVIHFDYEMDGTSVYPAMHKLAFRLGCDAPAPVRAIVKAFSQKYPNIKKWAALVPDYGWGHDCWDLFDEGVKKWMKGVETVKIVHPLGCPDFSPFILKITEAQPQALISFAWSGDMITFLKQAKPYELYKKVIGAHYGHIVDICSALKDEMEQIWTGLDSGYPALPSAINFSRQYKKEMGEFPPTDYTACYYDSLWVLKQAIEKAKSTKPENISKAMEGLTFSGKGAGWLHIRPTSHIADKKVFYIGRLAPSKEFPYFIARDLIEVPGIDATVTDEELKTKYKCPFPYKE
jgi:branched-chain amino acid transport system substrate-binding protein